MTLNELLNEGRRLARSAVLLSPDGSGDPVATWYERDEDEIEATGYRRWLTVRGDAIPGAPVDGFVTVQTNELDHEDGRVVVTQSKPPFDGTPLFPTKASLLSPIDAVFARGSDRVERWLAANGWQHTWGYNGNFNDAKLVEEYQREHQLTHPLYTNAAYAMLGGWHMSWPDNDFLNLIDEQLLVHTFHDSEPWIEAWRLRTGKLRVTERFT